MNKLKKSWEEEFDKRFTVGKHRSWIFTRGESNDIKDFIRNLLKDQKESLIEKVEDLLWRAKYGKSKPNLPYQHEQKEINDLLEELFWEELMKTIASGIPDQPIDEQGHIGKSEEKRYMGRRLKT